LERRVVPALILRYTQHWVYVLFAAIGSWIGAYVSITLIRRPPP
jgi:uncharacterized membrane protein YfcA